MLIRDHAGMFRQGQLEFLELERIDWVGHLALGHESEQNIPWCCLWMVVLEIASSIMSVNRDDLR